MEAQKKFTALHPCSEFGVFAADLHDPLQIFQTTGHIARQDIGLAPIHVTDDIKFVVGDGHIVGGHRFRIILHLLIHGPEGSPIMRRIGGVGGESGEDILGGVVFTVGEKIVAEGVNGFHLIVADALQFLERDEAIHEPVDHKFEILGRGILDFSSLHHAFTIPEGSTEDQASSGI